MAIEERKRGRCQGVKCKRAEVPAVKMLPRTKECRGRFVGNAEVVLLQCTNSIQRKTMIETMANG